MANLKFGLATLRGDDLEKTPVCPTSHKEVGQFYSPAASDIASQWYSAHAEWYLLRKFLEANKISLKP
ncbi:MAG: hypothetical protein IKM00_08515, partial [Clostridia bacterium]|nr:hypothetical protein [Clostridia bacterium]